jgi:hypothetical protein
VATLYSILVTTGRGSQQVLALTDIDQAALSIKKDLLMAQTTNLNATPQSTANMTWIDYTTSFGSANHTEHSAIYSLSGNQLLRNYDGTVSIVARRVTSVSFTQSDNFVTISITTTGGGTPVQTETVRFNSHMRTEVAN